MSIQGYLFDMDGLLLDTERVGMVAFQACLAPLDYDAEEVHRFYLSLIGGTRKATFAQLEAFLPQGRDVEEFYRAWWQEADRQMQYDVPLRPFAADVLAELSDLGAQMAVVTSTHGERARHKLEKAGILQHFETVIAGDDVSKGKPHPEPYLAGAQALGLDPRDCAAFEDSDLGIASAVEAGTLAVQVPDLRAENQELPILGQKIAPNLKEAVALAHATSQAAC